MTLAYIYHSLILTFSVLSHGFVYLIYFGIFFYFSVLYSLLPSCSKLSSEALSLCILSVYRTAWVIQFMCVSVRGNQQTSPLNEERQSHVGMTIDTQKLHLHGPGDFLGHGQQSVGLGLDAHHQHFEQVSLDPLQYGADFGSQLIPSMDSPNSYGMDYGQVIK